MSEFENVNYHRIILENQNKNDKNNAYTSDTSMIFMDKNGKWHKYEFIVEKPKKSWFSRLFEKMTPHKP